MRRTVVDTCVFVDFLRGASVPRFEALLRANSVLLSPYVRLELLLGVRRDEARVLAGLLGGIPQVPHQDAIFAVAESMAEQVKGSGLNVGLVDLLIAAQARLLRSPVLSSDRVFGKLAHFGLVSLAR